MHEDTCTYTYKYHVCLSNCSSFVWSRGHFVYFCKLIVRGKSLFARGYRLFGATRETPGKKTQSNDTTDAAFGHAPKTVGETPGERRAVFKNDSDRGPKTQNQRI
jgi:hypothetical protein